MKKTMIILTTLLVTIIMTACGNTEAKVNETETYVETEIEETVYEETETEEETNDGWTVEEAREEVEWVIEDIKTERESYFVFGEVMDVELADDIISILENIEYDENYKYGFDVEQWCLDVVTTYYEHGYCTLEEAILAYHEYVSDLDNIM